MDGDGRDGVTQDVTGDARLTGAERQRRYRQRRKQEREAPAGSGLEPDGTWTPAFEGQREPFRAGHQLSVVTGAGSPQRVGEVAERYKAALLGSAGTPGYLRQAWFDSAVDGWASAEAVCFLLRRWLDTQDIEAALTEFIEEDEDVSRPVPGAERRRSRGRRVASTLDALHKAEQGVGAAEQARARSGRVRADLPGCGVHGSGAG